MTYTGYLHLEVGKRHNQSVIINSFFDGVLKITRPTYIQNHLPLLTLLHVGGGYVDGDSYKTEVVVRQSASLALTTQASTKVYKSPCLGVTQTVDYVLENDSELYVKQDSLILYKEANFTQLIHVYMSLSATFYYTDIITPGWSEDGQSFQYQKLVSKMKIFMDGSLEVFDHLLLDPSNQLDAIMHLEGFTHIGSMFFIHHQVSDSFIEELRTELAGYEKQMKIGFSMLNVKGFSIRILANSTHVIEKVFSECEVFISKHFYQEERMEWRKGI